MPTRGFDRRPAALLGIALVAATVAACGSAIPPAMHVAAPLGPLGGEVRVLPPPVGASGGALPVVYFLHDFWGSDAVLWEHGVAQRLAAREASGDLPPFLLVAPEGDRSFWSDSWDGARRYESWLHNQLPAWVASRWHVRTGSRARAWIGISMGGLGAMKAGLRQGGETGAIVSISGLLVPLDAAFVRDARLFLRRPLQRVFGPGPDEAALRDSDPYRLLATLDDSSRTRRPPLLLLAGSEDHYHLAGAAGLFADAAREKGLTVDLRVTPGGHDWGYWRAAAEEGIAWAVRTLQREEPGT